MAEDYKSLMESLDDKLRKHPSTPAQQRYAEFTMRCKGYEFIEKATGKTFTKLQLYTKFINKDIRQLALLEENVHPEFIKRIKSGWKEIVKPSGETEAVRTHG